MAREPNLFYQDPTAEITASLGRALFGDPQARAKQQQLEAEMAQRQAQTEEARAHAGLYGAQTTGVGIQNDASRSLPALIANLAPRPAVAPVAVGNNTPGSAGFDAAFDSTVGPSAHQPSADEAFRAGLPAVIAALAQTQGDKVDPTKIIGSLGSFLGGDEMARRGLIAQGSTPGANFAITPERADAVADRDASAKQRTAFGVATIDHAHDIPVANIAASARRYGSDQSLAGTKYAADARGAATQYATDAKHGGTAPGFEAISAALPNATETSGWRSPKHNAEVGGVPNSNHLGLRPGVQAYDVPVQPGMTIDQAAARIEQANGGRVRVIEKLQHRATRPDGTQGGLHWHFALENVGGAAPARGRSTPAAKPVSAATAAMITGEVDKQIDANGQHFTPEARNVLRSWVMDGYQRTGNPIAAARQAVERANDNFHANTDTNRQMAAMGARRAPDGQWYVVHGKNQDGSTAYAKVTM